MATVLLSILIGYSTVDFQVKPVLSREGSSINSSNSRWVILARFFFFLVNFPGVECILTCTTVCQNHRNTVQMQLALPEHHADGLKRNSSIRVMLYCGENSHSHRSSATDISFPLNIEIKINDQEIRTNTKGVKGKPGSTRPVDITPFLRRHGATNIVSVTYALTTKVRHFATAGIIFHSFLTCGGRLLWLSLCWWKRNPSKSCRKSSASVVSSRRTEFWPTVS